MKICLINGKEFDLPKNTEIVENEQNKRLVDVRTYKYIGYTKLTDKVQYTIPISSILYIDYNERPKENT